LLLKKELDYFAKALESPKRPFLVILGGAKVTDKIQLIMNLLDKADDIIIGSAMAFPFLKVMHGMDVGKSMYDASSEGLVREVLEKAKAKGVNLHFPEDFVVVTSLAMMPMLGFLNWIMELLGIGWDWIKVQKPARSSAK